ncbi:hypothetical protein GQ457_17G026820 [Hibiscus cannabinus]
MVQATRLGANEHPFSHHRSFSLEQLPRNLVSPPVHLQVFVSSCCYDYRSQSKEVKKKRRKHWPTWINFAAN